MFDLQRDALFAAGVEPSRLYQDHASGKKDDRPGLEACLKSIREDDMLGPFFDHAEPSLRGAKRRSNPVIVAQRRRPLDCFASLAMTRRDGSIENRSNRLEARSPYYFEGLFDQTDYCFSSFISVDSKATHIASTHMGICQHVPTT